MSTNYVASADVTLTGPETAAAVNSLKLVAGAGQTLTVAGGAWRSGPAAS
jgi:hypothetical protein